MHGLRKIKPNSCYTVTISLSLSSRFGEDLKFLGVLFARMSGRESRRGAKVKKIKRKKTPKRVIRDFTTMTVINNAGARACTTSSGNKHLCVSAPGIMSRRSDIFLPLSDCVRGAQSCFVADTVRFSRCTVYSCQHRKRLLSCYARDPVRWQVRHDVALNAHFRRHAFVHVRSLRRVRFRAKSRV